MVVGGGLRGGHLLDNVVSSEDKEGDGSLSQGCRWQGGMGLRLG